MARRRADACYRELGAELRKRRIAANLTMRELAYHLDWSPSTVSRVESGYIGLPTTEVLPPPRSSRAIRFSGSAANTIIRLVRCVSLPLPDADERRRDRQLALIVGLLRRAYERRKPASDGGLRLS